MTIQVLFNDNVQNLHVRTPLNTFVEAYDMYLQEYVVLPVSETKQSINGVDYLVA